MPPRQTAAPIGTTPLVSPLAVVMMSGRTPKKCVAKGAPSRPHPVMTSSNTSRMPCRSQVSRSRSRYPLGGSTTPAEPDTGSTKTAAILSPP